METTPNLDLPYIMPSQAQKHVTHNEAIRALDAIVQLAVLDRALTEPPVGPADGSRYIVADAATGIWSGKDGQIAAFQDGAWAYYPPAEGWLAWVLDENCLLAWDGATWMAAAVQSVNPAPLVGVNATADASNRLSVGSPAVLFSHDGAGHQVKINKAAAGETASVLYQTGFSGRAEMGLAGDDDFHVKVSVDGASWKEAIVVKGASGRSGFGTAAPSAAIHAHVTPEGAGRAFIMTGKGITGTEDLTHGVILVLTHNVSGNRQFFLGNSESGVGLRVIGATLDGYNYQTSTRQNLQLGSDSTDVTTLRNLYALGHFRTNHWARVGGYTVAALPSAATAGAGAIIHVSDEAGGAVLAFSDGTSWRRVTDRAVVS